MCAKDRVAELENELIALQEQMVEQEQAANNAINEWQESFADAEKKCTDLESMLEATQQGNATSQLSTENEQEGIESSTRDLDEKIASLENAIDAEMDDLHQAETESAMDDAENVESLKEELKKANENLGHDEEIVTQWEGKSCLFFALVFGVLISTLSVCASLCCAHLCRSSCGTWCDC